LKSKSRKYRLFSLETLGILLVLISIIGILCLFAGRYLFGDLGETIRGFLFGVFGYLSYFILIIFSCLGIVSIAGVKIKIKLSKITKIISILFIISLVSIFHLGFNPYKGSFSQYNKYCYELGYKSPTVGGVLLSFLVGIFCSLIGTIGAYVVFSVFVLLGLIFAYLRFNKNKPKKQMAKVKSNKSNKSEVDLPFNVSNVPQRGADKISLPFGGVTIDGGTLATPKQSFRQKKVVTFEDVASKLDSLKEQPSYLDSVSGDNISTYVQPNTSQSYSDSVSNTIPSKITDFSETSYQEGYLDESAPSTKMFIPKDKDFDNPYTIRSEKVTIEEEKPQNSTIESAFDMLLTEKKSSTFEDEYKKAKQDQEKIIQEASMGSFGIEKSHVVEQPNIVEEQRQEVNAFENVTPSFTVPQSYVESKPAVQTAPSENAQLASVTYEMMKDYKYNPPPITLFKSYEANEDKEKLKEFFDTSIAKIKEVIKVMKNYDMEVEKIHHGPTFTRFDLPVPIGVPVKDIEGLATDMGLQLNANSSLRIAPVPNTNMVGIEVPNRERVTIGLKEVLVDEAFQSVEPNKCPFIIGKDVTGKSLVLELSELTHILLAGTSGSGKSVFVTALLVSLMCKVSPRDLRMIICDPKGVDFSSFSGAPHLLIDEIVIERQKIEKVLGWAVQEMDRRYAILQEARATKIAEYNKIMKGKDHMARILIFVDEFADLVSENGKEIMAKVQRLAQKARAAGIHLLLATQRPTTDIVSGTIKSNLSTRIALKVQNNLDSRIILEEGGAENLLVHGDMMFFSQMNPQIQRAQGPNISSDELFDVLNYIRDNNPCYFDERLKAKINAVPQSTPGGSSFGGGADDDRDYELKVQALKYVIETKKTSISAIQREFRIGFNKAALIHDWFIKEGYLGSSLENGKSPILITMDQFKAKFGGV